MSKCRGLASQLVSQRQAARCQRWMSKSSTGPRVVYERNSSTSPTVSPSQLLRYVAYSPTKTATDLPIPELDERLDLAFSRRHIRHDRKHLVSLPGSQQIPPDGALHTVASLDTLQLWFEKWAIGGFKLELRDRDLRNALLYCEKSHSSLEILSVLNAIITRLSLHGRKCEILHVTGLYYASQSFSLPAFHYHLNAVSKGASLGWRSRLHWKNAKDVVMCLLRTLRTIRLANPAYDTLPMLQLVAGKYLDPASGDGNLIDIIPYNAGIDSSLLELLLELGANDTDIDLFDALGSGIVRTELRDGTRVSMGIIDDAWKCVLLFLGADMTNKALWCMKWHMKKFENMPPSVEVSSELSVALNERGLEVPEIVKRQASQAQNISHDYDIASTDNLQLNDGMVDFSIVERLLSQIRQHGTSISTAGIAMVIDALNDCEGSAIPLFTQSVEDRTLEFAWSPRWIPVASNLESVPFSQTLGLLRAQMVTREILISSERCRNLIQLGHLVQREVTSTESDDFSQEDWPYSWEKTGYLVAFDRVSAEYLVVYLGESYGLIDPEYQLQPDQEGEESSPDIFEQHSVLGSLSSLDMPSNAQDLTRDIAHVVLPVNNAAKHYFFDLDPGDNLQP